MKTDSEKLDTIYKWVCSQAGYDDPKERVLKIGNLEIYPHDLPETMTYLNAVKAVAKLDDGWRIPTLEELRLMYKNKDTVGGVITTSSGSGYPDWYWSSTEHRDYSSYVWIVRLSDGYEGWHHKDISRLSCRPVRLVPVSAPSLG